MFSGISSLLQKLKPKPKVIPLVPIFATNEKLDAIVWEIVRATSAIERHSLHAAINLFHLGELREEKKKLRVLVEEHEAELAEYLKPYADIDMMVVGPSTPQVEGRRLFVWHTLLHKEELLA